MVLLLAVGVNAQGLKGLFKDPTKKDSTGKSTIDKMIGSGGKTSQKTREPGVSQRKQHAKTLLCGLCLLCVF